MSHAGIRVRPGLRTWFVLAAIFLVGALQLATGNPARADGSDTEGFTQTNLVSDVAGAKNLDSHLKNPWGIVHSPTSPWWVSDNNGNVSTLYEWDEDIPDFETLHAEALKARAYREEPARRRARVARGA